MNIAHRRKIKNRKKKKKKKRNQMGVSFLIRSYGIRSLDRINGINIKAL